MHAGMRDTQGHAGLVNVTGVPPFGQTATQTERDTFLGDANEDAPREHKPLGDTTRERPAKSDDADAVTLPRNQKY